MNAMTQLMIMFHIMMPKNRQPKVKLTVLATNNAFAPFKTWPNNDGISYWPYKSKPW